jgi:hypothetical protein
MFPNGEVNVQGNLNEDEKYKYERGLYNNSKTNPRTPITI